MSSPEDDGNANQPYAALFGAAAAVGVAVAVVISWFAFAPLRRLLSFESIQLLASWLNALGWRTPAISLLLLILQAVIPPLPVTPIIAVNGMLFDLCTAIVLSWTGSLSGAAASFGIARFVGVRWLGQDAEHAALPILDGMGEASGFALVLLARLTPFISLDAIGYLAGLSSMRFPVYLLACAIGQTPSVIAYTILGRDSAQANLLSWRLALILATMTLLLFVGRRQLKRLGLLG